MATRTHGPSHPMKPAAVTRKKLAKAVKYSGTSSNQEQATTGTKKVNVVKAAELEGFVDFVVMMDGRASTTQQLSRQPA